MPSSHVVPPAVLEQLRKYDTPTICNVIELFDVRPRTAGYMDARIQACYPKLPPMVGYASTATFRSAAPPRSGNVYSEHLLQLAAYRQLWEEAGKPRIGSRAVCEVGKVTITQEATQTLNLTLGGVLSLGDLGFSPAQTQGNAQDQARLDKRSHMLKVHQRIGLIATAPIVASVITGTFAGGKSTSGDTNDAGNTSDGGNLGVDSHFGQTHRQRPFAHLLIEQVSQIGA